MTLQEELTRIWQEKRPTVIFITHDVGESVELANRVVALSKGRGIEEIAVDLPRPLLGRVERRRSIQGTVSARSSNSCARPNIC